MILGRNHHVPAVLRGSSISALARAGIYKLHFHQRLFQVFKRFLPHAAIRLCGRDSRIGQQVAQITF